MFWLLDYRTLDATFSREELARKGSAYITALDTPSPHPMKNLIECAIATLALGS